MAMWEYLAAFICILASIVAFIWVVIWGARFNQRNLERHKKALLNELKESVQPSRPVAAPRIFISYRRSDSQDVSGRIYDALVARFSKKNVFKDVDSVPLGKDFRIVLHEAVCKAAVIIVVIGPSWMATADPTGKRRLDDVNDFVRIELETALEQGILIIPVTVSNAKMVTASELPTSIRDLAFQNGMPVRPDPDFHRDVGRLIDALETLASGASGFDTV